MRCNITTADVNTNHKPGTHIVLCLIEIWKPKKPLDFSSEPSFKECFRLCECQSFDCEESYRELIWEADLVLPKGTIIHKTIATIKDKEKANENIVSHAVDGGVVVSTTTSTMVADQRCFEPGMRIRVYTGYTTDPKIAALNRLDRPSSDTLYGNESKLSEYKDAIDLTFDGFISKCSPSAPFKIHAESITSILKKVTCGMDKSAVNGCSLKELFDAGGKWKLLSKTGMELHSKSPVSKLDDVIVIPNLRTGMTIADALKTWSKQHNIYFRMQDDGGVTKLRVGFSFSSGVVSDSEDTLSIYGNGDGSVPTIFFDYNVASDEISYANVDKYNLAVKCIVNTISSKGARGTYSFYARLDPSKISDDGCDIYMIYDEKALTKNDRKQQKAQGGKPKFDHSGYNVIERVYPSPIKQDKLDKKKIQGWAVSQLKNYNNNGLDGNLVLFGDLGLHTGDIVEFLDNEHPERNGKYLIDSVATKLSTEGLRQTIKVPYKLVSETK